MYVKGRARVTLRALVESHRPFSIVGQHGARQWRRSVWGPKQGTSQRLKGNEQSLRPSPSDGAKRWGLSEGKGSWFVELEEKTRL